PFEVGDYVTFAGTLTADGGTNGGYISAHTITDNAGIYTQPGIDPAYVSTEVALIGTGGLTVFGAGEAAVRTRFEGMTTDETRKIHIYGIDINPATGATSDRDWGSIMPDPGPPNGAVRGRWRFRPPCLAFGSVPAKPDKDCVSGPGNGFLPPTREVRAVIEGHQQFLPGSSTPNPASQVPGTPGATTTANGIFFGQYHAPIGEYIFPENTPGNPIVENNFNTIDFLAFGGYSSFSGVIAGVLDPWPSNVAPPGRVCATPTINGGPFSVANGASIQLSGSVNANATSPIALAWTAGTTPGGTDLNGALANATTTTPTFNATGLAAGTYNVTLTASNVCGAATVASTITVQAAPPPTINAIQDQTVTLGSAAASPVTVVATTGSIPTPTFAWTRTGGTGPAVAFTQTPVAATPTTASTLRFTPPAVGTYIFSATATNANGTSSPVSVTVTVTASTTTNIVITPAEYRTGKLRLGLTATTTDLAVTSMVLQPYLTDTGTVFDPASLGAAALTNGGGGVWTLTAVGVPRPACNLNPANFATPCAQKPLIIKAFTGAALSGTSAPTALDRIRN
ncbi:MAG TPA: PKD domain-containing protein, partial [Ilumatobacteraceae bacterium]|nr:PKD domain-containing protein [Ilumatobacteraceae bacterium]